MADLRVAAVMRTNDYAKFKRLAGNRDIGNRAEKIKKRIKTVGYIMSPIIVNEKFEIIDGQGRHKALSDLKLPIDYVVVVGAGLNECIAMNLPSTNWSAKDFISSYAEQGYPDYMTLQKLIDSSKITYTVIAGICEEMYCSGGRICRKLADGTFKIKDEARARKIILGVERVANLIPDSRGHSNCMLYAVAFCLRFNLVDLDELIKKLQTNSGKLKKTVGTGDALKVIEDIYNYHSRNKVYLAHEYEVYADARRKKSIEKTEDKYD